MLYNITLKRRFELDDIAKVRRITLPRKTDHYQLWTTGHLNEALWFDLLGMEEVGLHTALVKWPALSSGCHFSRRKRLNDMRR